MIKMSKLLGTMVLVVGVVLVFSLIGCGGGGGGDREDGLIGKWYANTGRCK